MELQCAGQTGAHAITAADASYFIFFADERKHCFCYTISFLLIIQVNKPKAAMLRRIASAQPGASAERGALRPDEKNEGQEVTHVFRSAFSIYFAVIIDI